MKACGSFFTVYDLTLDDLGGAPRKKKRPYTATKEEWAELSPQFVVDASHTKYLSRSTKWRSVG
jgi:hypothetical protein